MISVNIFRDENKSIVKYIVEGHARNTKIPSPIEYLIRFLRFRGKGGSPETGFDTICAAVSVAAQAPLTGMSQLLGVTPGMDMEDGYLECIIPVNLDSAKQEKVHLLLETMFVTLKNLEKSYSGFIKIVETEV